MLIFGLGLVVWIEFALGLFDLREMVGLAGPAVSYRLAFFDALLREGAELLAEPV